MSPLTINKTMINHMLKTTLLYGLDFSFFLSILNTRFRKMDQFPSIGGEAGRYQLSWVHLKELISLYHPVSNKFWLKYYMMDEVQKLSILTYHILLAICPHGIRCHISELLLSNYSTTWQSHIQEWRCPMNWSWNMRLPCCLKTSGTNCPLMWSHIPENLNCTAVNSWTPAYCTPSSGSFRNAVTISDYSLCYRLFYNIFVSI
jgi:hypothetical protein